MFFKSKMISAILLIPAILLLIYLFGIESDLLLYISILISLLGTLVSISYKKESSDEVPVVQNKDEGTELADSTKLFKVINEETNELNQCLDKLINNMNQVKGVSTDIMQGATIQTENVEKSTETMNEISSSIQQIASSTELVSSQSLSTAETAKEGSESIETVIRQMESIHHYVESLSTVITDLSRQSKEIEQIIETISDVAKQTNLLALNASIEAARAGEHGKGFAVVAGEVKKLSEEADSATQKIVAIVSSIQDNVSKSVQFMSKGKTEASNGIQVVNQAKQSFESIQTKVNDVSFQIAEVAASIQQLSAGSEEITGITEYTMKVQQGGTSKINQLNSTIETLLIDIKSINSITHNLNTEIQKEGFFDHD